MIKSLLNPHVPSSLLHQEILLRRKNLPMTIEQQYNRTFKGFIGERKLSTYFKEFNQTKAFPLYSLLFTTNETEFQIDSLLLTSEAIFLLEVKNYTGNYYMSDDKIYFLQTNKEVSSPFLQLDRSTFYSSGYLNS